MGTKKKFWAMRDDQRWLFKYNRQNHGEDWSEKIAVEIARQLAIASATVELAKCAERSGVISRNFVNSAPGGSRLVHGNELLNDYYSGSYPINESYRVSQHCIPAVRIILGRHSLSGNMGIQVTGPVQTLWHQFVGYLMLDALIGNSDRHHENWGLISQSAPTNSPTVLAPSFDHASSLGRELDDIARCDMLQAKGNRSMALYADRCRSKLYLDSNAPKPLTPLEAFVNSTADIPDIRAFWLNQLVAVKDEVYANIINQIPDSRMSGDARRFAAALLVYNRCRLLECGQTL